MADVNKVPMPFKFERDVKLSKAMMVNLFKETEQGMFDGERTKDLPIYFVGKTVSTRVSIATLGVALKFCFEDNGEFDNLFLKSCNTAHEALFHYDATATKPDAARTFGFALLRTIGSYLNGHLALLDQVPAPAPLPAAAVATAAPLPAVAVATAPPPSSRGCGYRGKIRNAYGE